MRKSPHALRGKMIGLVGAGNMGQALLRGLRASGIAARQLVVCESQQKARRIVQQRYGVSAANLTQLAARCNVILLAVKPHDLPRILEELASIWTTHARPETLVISIAAGVRLAALQRALGKRPIVRVMPNLPATVGAGMSALARGRWANHGDLTITKAIFESVGETVELPERLIDAVTAVSGSGPAYFFLLCQALRHAGIRAGISPDIAHQLAVQTALGSAQLAKQSSEGFEALIGRVASKRGTTEAALKVFATRHFDQTVQEAVTAARRRAKELSI